MRASMCFWVLLLYHTRGPISFCSKEKVSARCDPVAQSRITSLCTVVVSARTPYGPLSDQSKPRYRSSDERDDSMLHAVGAFLIIKAW